MGTRLPTDTSGWWSAYQRKIPRRKIT